MPSDHYFRSLTPEGKQFHLLNSAFSDAEWRTHLRHLSSRALRRRESFPATCILRPAWRTGRWQTRWKPRRASRGVQIAQLHLLPVPTLGWNRRKTWWTTVRSNRYFLQACSHWRVFWRSRHFRTAYRWT